MGRQRKSLVKIDNLKKSKIDELWNIIPPNDIADLIRVNRPENTVSVSANTILTNCVYHSPDKTPSLFINFAKKTVKCFGASCNHFDNDLIGLYAKLQDINKDVAIAELIERYGVTLLTKQELSDFANIQNAFHVLNTYAQITRKYLENAWEIYERNQEKVLELIQEKEQEVAEKKPSVGDNFDLNNLEKVLSDAETNLDQDHRNNDPDQEDFDLYADAYPAIYYIKEIRKVKMYPGIMPVGIIPPEHLIDKLIDIDPLTHQSLLTFLTPIRKQGYVGQLCFTYRHSINHIAYFKIRKIKNDTGHLIEGTLTREKSLTVLRHDDLKDYTDEASFFFDPYTAKTHLGEKNDCFIVEGEFDYLSLVTRQIDYGLPPRIFLATGGASNIDLNSIHYNFSVSKMFLLLDNPTAGGEELAYRIVKQNNGTIQPFIFKWDPEQFASKDPDELIIRAELEDRVPDTYTHILDDYNYYNEEEFILKKINEKLNRDKRATSKIKIKMVVKELQAIKDPILSRSLISKVSQEFSVEKDSILDLMLPSSMDENTFIKRLSKLMYAQFTPLGIVVNSRSSDADLVLFNNHKKHELTVSSSRLKEAQNVLAQETGSYRKWIGDNIGIPRFLTITGKGEPRIAPDVENDLRKYVGTMISDLMEGLPLLYPDKKLKGGNFYLENKTDPSAPKQWYVHNGAHLFLGTFDDNWNLKFKRSVLPSVNGHYFTLADTANDGTWVKWSGFATDEAKLNSQDLLPLCDIYAQTFKILTHCFSLAKESHYQILANFIIYTSIYQMFDRNIFLHISGETHTGKSQVGTGIIGGKSNPLLQIVEAVYILSHYSEAGVRQSASNRGLLMSLDEFEDQGSNDAKSVDARKILDVARTMENETQVIKGTPTGDAKVFTLNSPLLTMSVRPLSEAMDINRFLQISTKKKAGMPDTLILLRQIFNKEDIDLLRNSNTIVPHRYTKVLERASTEVKKYLDDKNCKARQIPNRTLRQLIPLATIYSVAKAEERLKEGYPEGNIPKKLINIDIADCQEFFDSYYHDNDIEIKRTSEMGHTPKLWEELLRTERFEVGRSQDEFKLQHKHTLMNVLMTTDLRSQLYDEMIKGVSVYLSDTEEISKRKYYLIISWNEARILFPNKSEFSSYPAQKLKSVADRHPDVIPESDIKDHIKDTDYIFRQHNDFSTITIRDITDMITRTENITTRYSIENGV